MRHDERGTASLRVLFASSEIFPLAKTGGLADVSAALPKSLAKLDIDIHLLLPGYPAAIEGAEKKSIEIDLADFLGAGPLRLISARTLTLACRFGSWTVRSCFDARAVPIRIRTGKIGPTMLNASPFSTTSLRDCRVVTF
jgi:hypothetical protein